MLSRLLAYVVVVTIAAAGFGGAVFAETFQVGPGGGFAKIDVSDAWSPRKIGHGLEARSPDEEVYIWAEAFTEETLQAIMAEHEAYFTKQGVAVVGPAKTGEVTRNGMRVKLLDVPATWKGKKTVLQYAILDGGLASGWKLLLTEWASPEGDKMYDAHTTAILDSVVFFGK